MRRPFGVLRRAWIDWHIGWHQSAAEAAEAAARRHREIEHRYRTEYRKRWPNPYQDEEDR